MNERREEVASKLAIIRNRLGATCAMRIRGTDWFAWITAGASNSVQLARETGVAEVLVTANGAWVLVDDIEAQRLLDEELPDNFQLFRNHWAALEEREEFVRDTVNGCQVCSDRPTADDKPLPMDLLQYKRVLTPSEVKRYQDLGRQTAEAMTEAMSAATPEWTELELAGAGAQALYRRGLQPVCIMAAGAERLPRYRQPMPTANPLGNRAMLTMTARGQGLHAHLTRFVAFDRLSEQERQVHDALRQIEAEALQCCVPGSRLDQIYAVLGDAYQRRGYTQALAEHHQGGLTGYRPYEILATPMMGHSLNKFEVVAWNPSLPGARMQDTFLLNGNGGGPMLEVLTVSSDWPTVEVGGLQRPVVWER